MHEGGVAKLFSRLHLLLGYWQIEIESTDQEKAALVIRQAFTSSTLCSSV